MLGMLLVFYMGYRIQLRRYVEVIEAVRARVRSEFPQRFVDPSR